MVSLFARGVMLALADPAAIALVWGCVIGATVGGVGLAGMVRTDMREARFFSSVHGAAAAGGFGVVLRLVHLLCNLGEPRETFVGVVGAAGPALHASLAVVVLLAIAHPSVVGTIPPAPHPPESQRSDVGVGLGIGAFALAAFVLAAGVRPSVLLWAPIPAFLVGGGVLSTLIVFRACVPAAGDDVREAVMWMLVAASGAASGILGGVLGLVYEVSAIHRPDAVGVGVSVAYVSLAYGLVAAAGGSVAATHVGSRTSGEIAGAVAGVSLVATASASAASVIGAFLCLWPVSAAIAAAAYGAPRH